MWGEESIYLSGHGATGFLKPYAGGRYAFAALLPETPAATRANEQMLAFFLQQAPDDAPYGADSATGGDGSGKILKIPR